MLSCKLLLDLSKRINFKSPTFYILSKIVKDIIGQSWHWQAWKSKSWKLQLAWVFNHYVDVPKVPSYYPCRLTNLPVSWGVSFTISLSTFSPPRRWPLFSAQVQHFILVLLFSLSTFTSFKFLFGPSPTIFY